MKKILKDSAIEILFLLGFLMCPNQLVFAQVTGGELEPGQEEDQPQYLDEFPALCAEATPRQPLDGHVVRLGRVQQTDIGWSFLFPDSRIRRNLQRVAIIDNVGLMGQDPEAYLGDAIRDNTPDGAFVVAQIYVADPNIEPVVTCLSQVRPLREYIPEDYGPDWRWLDFENFQRWLEWREFTSWGWRRYWFREFFDIRERFRGFAFERERLWNRLPEEKRERLLRRLPEERKRIYEKMGGIRGEPIHKAPKREKKPIKERPKKPEGIGGVPTKKPGVPGGKKPAGIGGVPTKKPIGAPGGPKKEAPKKEKINVPGGVGGIRGPTAGMPTKKPTRMPSGPQKGDIQKKIKKPVGQGGIKKPQVMSGLPNAGPSGQQLKGGRGQPSPVRQSVPQKPRVPSEPRKPQAPQQKPLGKKAPDKKPEVKNR